MFAKNNSLDKNINLSWREFYKNNIVVNFFFISENTQLSTFLKQIQSLKKVFSV